MYLKKMGRTTESGVAAQMAARRIAKSLLSLAALSTAFGLTACTRDYTLAYLYVTTSKAVPGTIDQYAVDYQSGALVPIGTPIDAGNDPVASVAAPNAKAIYVVSQGDSTVHEFTVGGNGTLTAANAYATTGNTPTALTTDSLGKFLFVTCTYQGTNTSGAGALSVYPINSDNSLGAPVNVNVGNNPVGVAIANFNPTVYVVDQDPNTPQVLAFAENTTTGALTPVTGSTVPDATTGNGFPAGVQPSAIAEDPTGRFVYVTDKSAYELIAYFVLPSGALQPMVNSTVATGFYPVSVLVDPRGKYAYVANYNANSIGAYALNATTGAPTAVAGSSSSTDTGPISIALDPALGIYVYTANYIGNTVTGQQLNPSTGTLGPIQNTPFPTAGGDPTSVVIVANGSHPTELLSR